MRVYRFQCRMAAAVVDAALAEHKLVIFSKTYCPFCDQGKDVSEVTTYYWFHAH